MGVRVKSLLGVAALVIAAVTGTYFVRTVVGGYQVHLIMPNAANLLKGSKVEIRGRQVGTITDLKTQDGQAKLTASMDGPGTPLHSGTKAQVQWQGVLGERVIELIPAPANNPVIPSGGILTAGTEQVEVDEVLSALDPDTRGHLKSTVQQLNTNLQPRQQHMQETLHSAGPAVQQLGAVLSAVGQDGPAIKSLITNLNNVTSPLADRRAELNSTVGDLSQAMTSMAGEQRQVQQALAQLPPTLDTAKGTMDQVPQTVSTTKPLLEDLRPATRQLTSVSRNLNPLLTDLRPTIADLRPTLKSANSLMRVAPGLLDDAHAVVPGATKAVTNLQPAVKFLRPYTPDLMGWISNWGGAFSNYDGQGHYFHSNVQVGTNAFDDNPGVNVGLKGGPNSRPDPGMATGKGWSDANGSGPR